MTDQVETVKTFGNPPIPVEDVVDEQGNTYCQVHTDRETGLRCNNCTRLMCAKCAVHTPVGYRCEQCVRQLEDRFFNADQMYYIRLGVITALLSMVGAYIANFVGFFLFVFFIAAAAGGIISEVATRYTKGQRGRYAGEVAAGGVVIGVLLAALVFGIVYLRSWQANFQLSEQQIAQIYQEYGQETGDVIIESFQGNTNIVAFLGSLVIGFITRFSVLIYTAITAFTVYGRFNIYGGRR